MIHLINNMAKVYKCPYCLYPFFRKTAIPITGNSDIPRHKCPNPRVIGRELECGKILPMNFFNSSSKVISIAGGTNVGKTYYLIALFNLLKNNRFLHKLGFSCNLIGDKLAIESLKNNWGKYKKDIPVQATKTEEGAHNKALIIDLMRKKGRKVSHVYLSFFDTPGEGYYDIEYMHKNFQCIYRADALLFLMEPVQVGTLRHYIYSTVDIDILEQVPPPHDLQSVFYNVIELLKSAQNNKKILKLIKTRRAPIRQNETNIINNSISQSANSTRSENDELPDFSEINIEETNPRIEIPVEEPILINRQVESDPNFWQRLLMPGSNAKVNCPIAVGLTKIDIVNELFINDIPYDNNDFDSMYLRGDQLNIKLIEDISWDIKDMIFDDENGEIAVKNLLEGQVKHYEFFGIKSGDVNKKGDIIDMNHPQGVLLPLLWLLTKINFF